MAGRIRRALRELLIPGDIERIVVPPKPAHARPRSSKWPAARLAWLHDHPRCAACGACTRLEVHHKWPFIYYPERELDNTNLVTLCEGEACNCHFVFGHSRDWRAYNPDVDSDAALALVRIRDRLRGRVGGV